MGYPKRFGYPDKKRTNKIWYFTMQNINFCYNPKIMYATHG